MNLDIVNRRILAELQLDCRLPIADLADRVGLSPSSCHRRVKQLEDAGVISGYVARLEPRSLGYTLEFFVEVALRPKATRRSSPSRRPSPRAPRSWSAT